MSTRFWPRSARDTAALWHSFADIGISRAALKDRFDLPFVYAGYSGGTRTGYIIVLAKEAKDRTP